MVLCVWGLPSKIAALQFEHAWQHPSVSRHVRDAAAQLGFCHKTARGRQRTVYGTMKNMQILFEMLQVSPYNGMPLRVHILDQEAYHQTMPKISAAIRLPKHMSITSGGFDELESICAEMMTAMRQPVLCIACGACRGHFRKLDRVLLCHSCETPFHVSCAAKAFTGISGKDLMPRQSASCPKCGKKTDWPVLIRSARRLSQAPSARFASDDSATNDSNPVALQFEQDSDCSSFDFAASDDGEPDDVAQKHVVPFEKCIDDADCPLVLSSSDEEGRSSPGRKLLAEPICSHCQATANSSGCQIQCIDEIDPPTPSFTSGDRKSVV